MEMDFAANGFEKLLATLLHYANSSPPCNTTDFYALKERLLKRYGKLIGYDMQEIRKDCWGSYSYREDNHIGCQGDCCRQCGGTGIYSIRWHSLERWEWCGFVFHRPAHTLYTKPETPVTIHGRIEHKYLGRIHGEAVLWLYLLTGEWRLFWHAMRCSRCCGWVWWPMLNLQKVVMELSMRLRRQRCWCGKMFWTWGSGWQICKKCRREDARKAELWDEIPF